MIVEGLVDHHLLTVHHVRDDVADPLWRDAAFLGFGAGLMSSLAAGPVRLVARDAW